MSVEEDRQKAREKLKRICGVYRNCDGEPSRICQGQSYGRHLVVDMAPFWQFYREVKPFFDKEWKDVVPETQQSPKEIKEIERYIFCVLAYKKRIFACNAVYPKGVKTGTAIALIRKMSDEK